MEETQFLSREENPDPMGRPCYRNEDGLIMMIRPDGGQHVAINTSESWNTNLIQFARLLIEISLAGLLQRQEDWDSLKKQTGLNDDELHDLFTRAQDVVEREKQISLGTQKRRWTVQHQFDYEDTYVVDREADSEDDAPFVQFSSKLPWHLRLFAAKTLALILNTDGRFGPKDAYGVHEMTPEMKE